MISYSFNLFAAIQAPAGPWTRLGIVTGEMKAQRNLIFLWTLGGIQPVKKYFPPSF